MDGAPSRAISFNPPTVVLVRSIWWRTRLFSVLYLKDFIIRTVMVASVTGLALLAKVCDMKLSCGVCCTVSLQSDRCASLMIDPIRDPLQRLQSLLPLLDELQADAITLTNKVSNTAKTADRVGNKVRSLDEEMRRVREAGDRVGLVIDLKARYFIFLRPFGPKYC